MSMTNSTKITSYQGVGVMRDTLALARVHYEIHVYDEGFAGYAVWARNDIRLPLIAHLSDFLKRRKRASMTVKDAVALDERSFYVAYSDIQGIVNDGDHKEIQLLSNTEQMTILFRPPDDYEEFMEHINKNVKEKVFSRDEVKTVSAVYV